MAFLFKPSRSVLQQAGLGVFSVVPFLLSDQLRYIDVANRYLRKIATGRWHPRTGARTDFANLVLPSDNSLMAYGRDIENFMSYLEYRGIDWQTCDHDLLGEYKGQMTSGQWSADNKSLSKSTVRRRVCQAANFLNWTVDAGLREQLHTCSLKASDSQGDTAHPSANPRTRSRREHPVKLRLPTIAELDRWEKSLRVRECTAVALGCKMINRTGARLEEATYLRAKQVPDPRATAQGAEASMEICYGTKGGRKQGDPELKGFPRVLRFEQSFLHELHNYRTLVRPIALRRFRELHPNEQLPLQLFLSPSTGLPISKHMLYKGWRQSSALPFKGFSPHLGRHTFACYRMLRLLVEQLALVKLTIDKLPHSTVMQFAGDIIDLHIRPVMGHKERSTSEIYLTWLSDQLLVTQSQAWTNFLDSTGG